MAAAVVLAIVILAVGPVSLQSAIAEMKTAEYHPISLVCPNIDNQYGLVLLFKNRNEETVRVRITMSPLPEDGTKMAPVTVFYDYSAGAARELKNRWVFHIRDLGRSGYPNEELREAVFAGVSVQMEICEGSETKRAEYMEKLRNNARDLSAPVK